MKCSGDYPMESLDELLECGQEVRMRRTRNFRIDQFPITNKMPSSPGREERIREHMRRIRKGLRHVS